ncbi:MAG: fibronectin type III domain-containing protein [Chitinophagaceae bacterium]|nr:fibronectin type III domain-containing protein [Chitinophagaceae bacterium]
MEKKNLLRIIWIWLGLLALSFQDAKAQCPSISVQPANWNACTGTPTSVSISTTGVVLSYQWEENTGSGYLPLSNAGIYSGVNTPSLTISPASSAMSNYSYRCVINGSCGNVISNDAIMTVNANNWVGGPGFAWNNPANWSCGVVPGPNDDAKVTMLFGTGPTIGAGLTAECRNLTKGGFLSAINLNNATLILHGDLIYNGGSFTSNAGSNFVFNGTSLQHNTGLSNLNVTNITVNNPAGLELNQWMFSTGTLTMQDGYIYTNENILQVNNISGIAPNRFIVTASATGTPSSVYGLEFNIPPGATRTYPIGATPTTFNPVTLTNTSGPLERFGIVAINSVIPSSLPVNDQVQQSWHVYEWQPGGNTADFSLQWDQTMQEGSNFTNSNCAIVKSDGVNLDYIGYTIQPGAAVSAGGNHLSKSITGVSDFYGYYGVTNGTICSVSVSLSASANPACLGSNVTFTATPVNGGANPIYDFSVNGLTVQSSTSNTYTTNTLMPGDQVDCFMFADLICAPQPVALSNLITMNIGNNPQMWYQDGDNDTYYAGAMISCGSPGIGWTTTLPTGGSGDCNDANAQVHPGLSEVYGNAEDDDCNGLIEHELMATVMNPYGTISFPGSTIVLNGGSFTYFMTPTTGYSVQDVIVDGLSQGPINSYTFSNITTNHSIEVLFYNANCVTASGLTANNITGNSALLNWNIVGGATWYKTRYRVASPQGPWVNGTITPNYKQIAGLASSTTYDVQVAAMCPGSSIPGAYSPIVQFTTLGACPSPVNLSTSTLSGSNATLTWSAVPNAAWYSIRYRTTSPLGSWIMGSSTGNSKYINGLMGATNYEFQVASYCNNNNTSGPYSASAFFTTPGACGAATNLTVSNITTTTASLSWSAVAGASWYDVRYRFTTPNVGNWVNLTTTVANKNISGLNAGSGYEFEIRTHCNDGSTAAWSGVQSFTTLNLNNKTTPADLDKQANSNLNVYPNPASQEVNIDIYLQGSETIHLQLRDMSGRLVKQIQLQAAEGYQHIVMPIADLTSGIYTLMIQDDQHVWHTQKLVKQ